MYFLDGGKKIKASSFGFGGISEGFSEGYNYDQKNRWMWYLLFAMILVSVILFVMWLVKRRKLKGGFY
jgi:hypothetical protein